MELIITIRATVEDKADAEKKIQEILGDLDGAPIAITHAQITETLVPEPLPPET